MLVLLMLYILNGAGLFFVFKFHFSLEYNIFIIFFFYSLFISEIIACHQLRVLRLCSVSRFLFFVFVFMYFLQGIDSTYKLKFHS
jgi:hypothetical protein